MFGKNKVSTQCGYREVAARQVRFKRWSGRRFFTADVSELEAFQPALKKMKINEDLTRTRRAHQAIRMKKMFNGKTKVAKVGDFIKVRLYQRDVKKKH